MEFKPISVKKFKDVNLFKRYKSNRFSRFDKNLYYDDYICLDTETSHNHAIEIMDNGKENTSKLVGWIYQWAITINDFIVYGRKPSEFITFLDILKEKVFFNENHKIVIFVHNLSYDIQYLYRFLIANFGDDFKILALENHKFITFSIDCFIFKCTYRLSNRSLAKWGKDLNIRHKKLVGEIDYSVIRTQQSKLVKSDWCYMFRDVIALRECIIAQNKLFNDNITTMPLTSTGYVRREARKKFRNEENARQDFTKNKNDFHVFELLENTFAGAISHGNRYYLDREIKGTIKHRDFVSHYPSQQRVNKFPVEKFSLFGNNVSRETFTKKRVENKCYLMVVLIKDITLKDKNITMPYLQTCKVLKGLIQKNHLIEDNGRVLQFIGTTVLYLTEIDYDILDKYYNFKCKILELYSSKADFLPSWLVDTVDEFMKNKTHFKDMTKKFPDNVDYATSLMTSKNMLNGIYGMTATNPCRESLLLNADGTWSIDNFDKEKEYNKYYKNLKSFMRFEWGVWTTAHARKELIEFYEVIGAENFLYCDTDSIFYISDDETEKKIQELNDKKHKFAIEHKAFITTENGKTQFYDIFEEENENITSFKFLHSKCYGYYTDDGKMHITIAGVPRNQNGVSREKELKSLDNLTSGFTFKKCGGTRTVYVESDCDLYNFNGQLQEVSSCAIILNTTKTMTNCEDLTYKMLDYTYN